jgi:hypothetical protein
MQQPQPCVPANRRRSERLFACAIIMRIPWRSGHETHHHRVRLCVGACWYFRTRPRRRTERPGFYDRRSRGKLSHPWRFADHRKFDEAEPQRKRYLHLRRSRCQRRSGQRHDARDPARKISQETALRKRRYRSDPKRSGGPKEAALSAGLVWQRAPMPQPCAGRERDRNDWPGGPPP